MGFQNFGNFRSRHPAIRTTGLLTFALAGLSPAEHTSVSWSPPSDLLKYPLLRLEDWSTWTRWFATAGISNPVLRGPILSQASMLIDAAVDGQGVALARTTLAAWDLINGRLVVPIDVSLRTQKTYWIVCPKVTASMPKIRTFRDWLLSEASEDARRLRTLAPKIMTKG